MKRTFIIAAILVVATSLSAKQYPDSVRQAAAEEPNIAYGWNFEFGGGLGVSSSLFKQLGSSFTTPHTTNLVSFPAGQVGLGINYYFVPWMGIGTGLDFSIYTNKTSINKPWTATAYDRYGTAPMNQYTMTSTPLNLTENQSLYMLEVPLALKFRARPGKVGFVGTAGVKLGFPMINNYRLVNGGRFDNQVYYPYFDLQMQDVPTVIDDVAIPESAGSLTHSFVGSTGGELRLINYAAYLELGMLIQLTQRIDLAISAYGTYYFTDLQSSHATQALGFANGTKAGEYPMPYTTAYNGVLRTNEVESLHPWSAGLKVTVQINANRRKAERDYDREQRRLRKLAQDSVPVVDTIPEPVPVDTVEEPIEEIIAEDLTDPRERAILQIMQIAEENGINICEEICVPIPVFMHDTIYINCEEADPAVKTAAAKKLAAVVYFHLDKSDPILQPKNVLTAIAKELRHYPDQKVEISGYACRLGKPGYNRRLALRRAKAVAAKLRAMGVREDQMIVTSHGATESYKNTQQHPLSKDRRVEIYWAE